MLPLLAWPRHTTCCYAVLFALVYFPGQVYGPTAVNVHDLLEALRQQGEIYPIGVEVRPARAWARTFHRV